MASNRKTIKADDALEYGLDLELGPVVSKEVTADKDGKYIGLNGTTYDDMNMVGTGQYINTNDWNQMGPGYSIVTNPYMAATPDQIADRKQASQVSTGTNDMGLLGDESYNVVLGAQARWNEYTSLAAQAEAAGNSELAAEYRAKAANEHDIAEAERAKYGYSGGADGSEYLGLMAYTGGLSAYDPSGSGGYGGYGGSGGYAYDPYLSKYQSRIDALANAILNREAFSYDKETDPLYQQYKTSYTRGGQRAMQDTLAQVSARTGGLASSYATSASQQTYNNYMAQLADKVPELHQLAYSMYMDDLNQDRADLNMLQGLEEYAYGMWQDDRNFDYGMYRDTVADQQWQTQFDYNAQQDALAQQNWQTQFDYNAAQDALAQQNWQTQWDYNVGRDQISDSRYAQSEARELALEILANGGTPTSDLLAAAGISAEDAKSLLAQDIALGGLGGGVTGGNGGTGGTGGTPTGGTPTGGTEPESTIVHPEKIGNMTLEDFSEAASNYMDMKSMCEQVYDQQGTDAVLNLLREARATNALTPQDYSRLFSMFRNKAYKEPAKTTGSGGGGGTNTHMAY